MYQSACVSNRTAANEESDGLRSDSQTLTYAWGRNLHGTLGLSGKSDSIAESQAPVKLMLEKSIDKTPGKELTGVCEVACGLNHMLVLQKGASTEEPGGVQILATGLGNRGRLGRKRKSADRQEDDEAEEKWTTEGNFREILLPVVPRVRVLQICCGSDHSLCLCGGDTRTVFSWGMNDQGQCGVGGSMDVLSPEKIAKLPPPSWADKDDSFKLEQPWHLAAGARHSMLVTSPTTELDRPKGAGLLYTWGSQGNGRLGHGLVSSEPQHSEAAGAHLWPRLVEALAKAEKDLRGAGRRRGVP